MDFFLNNNEKKKRFGSESRWNRIEKRHIHSIHRNDAASEICKNLIKNKDFIKERQMKALMGENTIQWSLDPNRVMDLRHFNVRRHKRSREPDFEFSEQKTYPSKKKPICGTEDREQFKRMQDLNHEIKKFKQNLENIRPKKTDLNEIMAEQRTAIREEKNKNRMVKIVLPFNIDEDRSSFMGKSDNDDTLAPHSTEQNETFREPVIDSNPEIIISESEKKNDELNFDEAFSYKLNTEHETKPKTEKHLLQPNINNRKVCDNVELVITPSFSFDIQETRSDISIESSCEDTSRESRISLEQHMSILIRNLHLGSDVHQNGSIVVNETFASNPIATTTEKDNIVNGLFQCQNGNDFIILQKYFLRWVHYTTIERLIRRNPEQSRLQKMQMFLQNITTERKKSLAKLRTTMNNRDNCETKKSCQHQMESPRLMMRKYNNKIRTQQDIIELQKMKLRRQERIIADLKLSKLFEDMNEAENHLKEGLKFVARKGCQNSRSKARCLQIAGNLKDGEDDERYQNLQAKGLSAPKFLIEMQSRALEREMRHQRAQQRRESLEREKEALRIAAELEKRLEDEEAKRQRIRDLKRKRKEEKALEARRALERMKFLADLEKAKDFHRMRQYKKVFEKFRNLINWKKRNERISNIFRRRLISRIWFNAWRKYTQHIWHERKLKADLCYRKHILRLGWMGLENFYLIEHNKKLLADDWYDLHLTDRMFHIWHKKMVYRRMKYEIKLKQAEAHYDWQLRWKVLEHWRHLHAILQIEKETEARRERWRSKIYDLIPDYTPNK